METSFGDRFTENDTRERRLPPHLHAEFYDKLKGLVVGILAVYKPEVEDGTRRVAREGQKYAMEGETADHGKKGLMGSGVFINREGWILTCAHVIPETTQRVKFCFEHTRGRMVNDFHPVVVTGINRKVDLAILKPRNPITVNYAMLSPGQMFEVGMEVFTISHPRSLMYTYASGQIMYPNYRLAGEVRGTDQLKPFDGRVQLLEINNLHCGEGSSGGPVFDSRGRVIGINAFGVCDVNYAVHLSHITIFWKNLQSRELEKKRLREGGDSSTSQSRPTKSLRLGGSSSTPSKEKGASKGSSTKSVGEAFGISKGSKIIQDKQSSQPEFYGPYGFVEFVSHAIPSKAMSQSPTSENMEESTRTKEIFSHFYEPAYGPVPPSEPSQDWQQMDVYDPTQGQALAGGYQGDWHDYQYADQLAYPEQYLLQTIENYDVQTGLNIQLDPCLMTEEEKDRGLGSASKCDNQRLQQPRERDSWEKDLNFISDSYSE